MNMPIEFSVANIIGASYTPHNVQITGNSTYNLLCRYLWQKVCNVFKFKLPDTFGKEIFLYSLFGNGVVTVFDSGPEFGVLAQWGNPGGYTVNYEPRYMMVSNPLLPEITGKQLVIGEECAVIRLTNDWHGVGDLIGFYAGKMALAAQAIDMNLINSKLSYVFAAKDKTQAKSFKVMMDDINSGKPSVVIDKSLFAEDGSPAWNAFQQNLQQTYITSDLLSDFRKIEEEFDTKIGIPNANTDKRERLITDEVNANNVETQMLAAAWLDNIRADVKIVNEMYGLDITADWRFDPNEREQSQPVDSRPVYMG